MDELTALYELFKAIKSKQTPLSKLINNVNELKTLFRNSLYDGSIADFMSTAYKAHSLGKSVDPQEQINELQNIYFEMKIFDEFRNILVHCRELTVNIIMNIFDYLLNNLQFINLSLFLNEWTKIFQLFFANYNELKRKREDENFEINKKSKHSLLKLKLLITRGEVVSLKSLRPYGLLLIKSLLKTNMFTEPIKLLAWLDNNFVLIRVNNQVVQIKDTVEAYLLEIFEFPKSQTVKHYKDTKLMLALINQPVKCGDKSGIIVHRGDNYFMRVFYGNEEIQLKYRDEIKILDF